MEEGDLDLDSTWPPSDFLVERAIPKVPRFSPAGMHSDRREG